MATLPIRRTANEYDPFSDYATKRSVILTISPEKAAEILEKSNPHNRGFTIRLVDRLADELTSGRWECNGETIIFSGDGLLLDGQHRLAACVKSGVSLTTYVVFGCDPTAFDTIDKGKSRSVADDLSISGERFTTGLAATLALLYQYDNGGGRPYWQSINTAQAFETLDKHPGVRRFVEYATNNYRKCKLTPRILAFAYMKFSAKDYAAADKFFEDLMLGANLPVGDPVLCLRNRLRSERTKSKVDQTEMLALTIKAWNARRKGKSINNLRWRTAGDEPEEFPIIQ